MYFQKTTDFNKLTENTFQKMYPGFTENIATGGHASYFGNKNWSGYSRIVDPIKQITDKGVIINFGISIDVRPTFDLSNEEDFRKMTDDIGSTLYHELHHCYEHYVRVIKNTNVMRPENRSFNSALSWAENIWKYPKPLFKFWSIFTYYLYVSEYHETRANIQEIFASFEYPNPILLTSNHHQRRFSVFYYKKRIDNNVFLRIFGHENHPKLLLTRIHRITRYLLVKSHS
jgi:hypothetical protein